MAPSASRRCGSTNCRPPRPAGSCWQDGRLVSDPQPRIDKGRVLLLVHGTFSKSQMWFDELQATEAGRKLLAGRAPGERPPAPDRQGPRAAAGAWHLQQVADVVRRIAGHRGRQEAAGRPGAW